MSKDPIIVTTIAEMRQIQKALDSDHHGFPVINTAGHMVGLIPKNVLLALAEQKCFYETSSLSMASRTSIREARNQNKDLENASSLIEKLEIINS